MAHGSRGVAAQGVFSDHAHGTAQDRPAAIGVDFIPEAVGTVQAGVDNLTLPASRGLPLPAIRPNLG